MTETTFSWSQIESPVAETLLALGAHVIRGWVFPKPGTVLVNVRARIGNRVFDGVHGLPCAAIAAEVPAAKAGALAGFEVTVNLEAGDESIILEALDLVGRWAAFESLRCRIDPAAPHRSAASLSAPLSWLDFVRAVEAVLRRADGQPASDWTTLAREVVAKMPYPRDLRQAPPPFIGFIDEPVILSLTRYGRVPAFGHLFHSELKIARVFATVDLQVLQPLEYGLPSPGPAAFYTQQAHAVDCGFAGFVDVPSQLPNPISLRLYAELSDGSLHLAQVVRTDRHMDEEEKIRLAATRDELTAVIGALKDTLATRSILFRDGPELEQGLSQLAARVTRHPSRVRPQPTLLEAPPALMGALPRLVIFATHGLTPQGAPRFLLDLARALADAGVAVQVVSAGDGPLRDELVAIGARVHLVDLALAFDTGEFASALSSIDWSAADIVVANTFTAFWAVHAARTAGRPSLLYVHESTTPAEFYGARVRPAVIELAEESITSATAVSFTTAATSRYHRGAQRLAPPWVDIAALDRWRTGRPWAASRAGLGVEPGEFLVCNIGTVCDRKGQHAFVRAVDLLWRRHPQLAQRGRFILLGGRETPADRMLTDLIRAVARPNLSVHPESTDYLDYYHAADLLACSSYEESSPRVILEAMALGTPIFASAVHGVPELVRADREAMLLPPGDTVAWCEALARRLAQPSLGHQTSTNARARAVEQFDAKVVLPRHLGMIAEVARGTP